MHDPDCDGRARVGADKGFHLAKLNSIEQTPQRTSCPKGAKITSFKVEAVILFLRHGKGHLVSHTMTEEWRVKRWKGLLSPPPQALKEWLNYLGKGTWLGASSKRRREKHVTSSCKMSWNMITNPGLGTRVWRGWGGGGRAMFSSVSSSGGGRLGKMSFVTSETLHRMAKLTKCWERQTRFYRVIEETKIRLRILYRNSIFWS